MTGISQIQEILSLYRKHGWILRRVLLSDSLRTSISDQLETLFGPEITFVSSEINAVWFSRPAKNGEAWELRHLSENPFALFETFSEDDDEEVREEARYELEESLKSRILQKKQPEKSR